MSSWIPATAAARAGRTAPAADATRAGVAAAVALGAGVPDTAAARALGGQRYVGAGGGASLLEPDDSLSLDVDDNAGTGATLFLGRGLDDRSSVQVQPYSLGEARFDGGSTVGYRGGDANVLYRFLDTRDTNLSPRTLNLVLYGRFGLGYPERDTDVSLDDDSPVYFGAGAGLELGMGRNAALRLEGIHHDTDAGSAWLSAVVRFGGARIAPPRRTPVTDPVPGPSPNPSPSAIPSPSPSAIPGSTPGARGTDPSTAARVAGSEAPPLPAPGPDATTAFPDEPGAAAARVPGVADADASSCTRTPTTSARRASRRS